MKILLIGNLGQVGWELERTLAPLGEICAVDFPEIDLAKPEALRRLVRDVRPHLIVNAAAYTDVDKAEREPELAMAINGQAPGILAEEARRLHAALVHFSTDYVFDGTKGEPYVESDVPNPVNVYGSTKLAGEQAVGQVDGAYLILRTGWVYSLRRECFVTKVLRWSRQHRELRIVEDQIGSPTWARTLAEATALTIAKSGRHPADLIAERKGIYHIAGSGSARRLEWANEVLRLDPNRHEQLTQVIIPAQASDFLPGARRPATCSLEIRHFTSTFNLGLPPWREGLRLALMG